MKPQDKGKILFFFIFLLNLYFENRMRTGSSISAGVLTVSIGVWHGTSLEAGFVSGVKKIIRLITFY